MINFKNQYDLLTILVKSWDELYIYILNMKKVKKYVTKMIIVHIINIANSDNILLIKILQMMNMSQ